MQEAWDTAREEKPLTYVQVRLFVAEKASLTRLIKDADDYYRTTIWVNIQYWFYCGPLAQIDGYCDRIVELDDIICKELKRRGDPAEFTKIEQQLKDYEEKYKKVVLH
jgi:uncharacterized protein YihD (DUF1040 family)